MQSYISQDVEVLAFLALSCLSFSKCQIHVCLCFFLFCFVLFLTDNSNDSLNLKYLDTKNMRRSGPVGI
jgi:hypothetical protein